MFPALPTKRDARPTQATSGVHWPTVGLAAAVAAMTVGGTSAFVRNGAKAPPTSYEVIQQERPMTPARPHARNTAAAAQPAARTHAVHQPGTVARK